MIRHRRRFWIIALSLLGLPTCLFNRHAVSQAPDGSPLPELSGFWEPKYTEGPGNFSDVFGVVEPAQLQPLLPAMDRFRGDGIAYGGESPVDGSACRILAFPFFMGSSPPWDVLQTKDEIVILAEREQGSRHIYMHGPHPEHVVPSSNGDSIGHWEGKTLVVDTVGFSGFSGVPSGGRRGPNTHLIERYDIVTLPDKTLRLDVTFRWEDPTIYVKPHIYTFHYYKMPASTYALEDPCDSGDPKEYKSANGITVIGNQAIPEARTPAKR